MTETLAQTGDVGFAGTAGPQERRWRWTHLKHSAATEAALHAEPALPGEVTDALLERDTIPRVLSIEPWTVVILRAINKTQGAEPEDMISLRLAVTEREVLSLELRPLRQVERLTADFRAHPPPSPAAFFAHLVEMLRGDVEPVLDELEDDIAALERKLVGLVDGLTAQERAALIDARQDAIQLHRYIAPQALALDALLQVRPRWLGDRRRLKGEAAAFRRIAADLESLRGRAQLVAEEASMNVMERTNRIMLTLSVVSVVFLPVTALTGLLGVNLAGIPFADAPWAFAAFCALLLGVAGVGALIAWRMLR